MAMPAAATSQTTISCLTMTTPRWDRAGAMEGQGRSAVPRAAHLLRVSRVRRSPATPLSAWIQATGQAVQKVRAP